MLEDRYNTEKNRQFLRTAYKLISTEDVAEKMGKTRAALNLRLNSGKNLKVEETLEAMLELGLQEKVNILRSGIKRLKRG